MLPLVIQSELITVSLKVVLKTQATYYKGREQVSHDVKWSWVYFLPLKSAVCNSLNVIIYPIPSS
jgi:hypothetical protein